MIALTYVSTSTMDFGDEDLVKLLETEHEHNAKANISGLLLYNGAGTFIQVLEGDDDAVDDLYKHIKTDTRHRRVTRLSRETILERTFANWKMGFRKKDPSLAKHIDGYSDYWDNDKGDQQLSECGTVTQRLLASFKGESQELIF